MKPFFVSAVACAAILTGCAPCGDAPALSVQDEAAPASDGSSVELLTLDGQTVRPLAMLNHSATVFLFTRFDCPVSNRYAPEVVRMCEQYAPEDIAFFLVYPNPAITNEAIRAHLADYAYPCTALRDPQHQLVDFTGVEKTPEAAVFDREGRLVYRGRIDDRFVDFGQTRPAPTRHDLADALDAILANRAIATPRTPAVGCFISDLK